MSDRPNPPSGPDGSEDPNRRPRSYTGYVLVVLILVITVLVVRKTDRLPGEGFFHGAWKDGTYDGPATGPEARAYIDGLTETVFGHTRLATSRLASTIQLWRESRVTPPIPGLPSSNLLADRSCDSTGVRRVTAEYQTADVDRRYCHENGRHG